MKNKTDLIQIGLLSALLFFRKARSLKKPLSATHAHWPCAAGRSAVVSDTQPLCRRYDRTLAKSGGVSASATTLEIDQLSEVEIVATALKIVVNSGGLRFNFPVGTAFEIVTPN